VAETCHRCQAEAPENREECEGWVELQHLCCEQRWVFCPGCRGEVITEQWLEPCDYCGDVTERAEECPDDDEPPHCVRCDGSGEIIGLEGWPEDCPRCCGTGEP
jgi:hypothetical protein